MLGGITSEALKAIQQSARVILISWFEDQRQSFIDYYTIHKVPFELWDGTTAIGATQGICIIKSDALGTSAVARLSEHSKNGKLAFFFGGHYPLLPRESEVLEKLKGLNRPNISISFCQSLDGALLKYFGGGKLVSLLEQLGLKDDECIEHAMITTSITRARQKLTKEVTNEMSARTEADWFVKNLTT